MFNESNTVQRYITKVLSADLDWSAIPGPNLTRSIGDVFLPDELRAALIRLNPEIAAQPDRADEFIYRLNAILLAVGNNEPELAPFAISF